MRRALAVLAATLAAACASGRMSNREPDRLFRQGNYEEAAAKLEKGLEQEGQNGRDTLLYLMDLGLALHSAGKYEESNKYLLKADKIAEIKDYTSLTLEGATLLTTDNIKDYKGEDFEKVLINTYLAMNYALMGDAENALVEARVVNHKLYRMVTEGERKYKQNAFARYLSAILYEAEQDFNDAYIDYQKTWELEPSFPRLGLDLWRLAWLTGRRDEMERWERELRLTDEDKAAARAFGRDGRKSGQGEIVVLYENGISPVKKPNPAFHSLPKFYPRYNPVAHARVELDGSHKTDTARLHDVEATAIQNLDEKFGALLAKKVAGVVAKEVVADQVERHTGDPLLGLLARVILYASDEADVRSWNLLPRDLQVSRLPVDAGTHSVRVIPIGDSVTIPEKTVQVRAGQKIFVNFRYVPRL